jgi:hypothetical protein
MPEQAKSELIAIYDAGRQQWKVRAVYWFLLVLGLMGLCWGLDIGQHYGLNPADGGNLRPAGERWALGIFLILFSLLVMIGMDIYRRSYICQAWLEVETHTLRFETPGLWGYDRISIPAGEIIGSRYHSGDLQPLGRPVNAPWYFVGLRGRKLPLILDGQGRLLQPGLARRLLNLK